jgi:hypothetical protein
MNVIKQKSTRGLCNPAQCSPQTTVSPGKLAREGRFVRWYGFLCILPGTAVNRLFFWKKGYSHVCCTSTLKSSEITMVAALQ